MKSVPILLLLLVPLTSSTPFSTLPEFQLQPESNPLLPHILHIAPPSIRARISFVRNRLSVLLQALREVRLKIRVSKKRLHVKVQNAFRALQKLKSYQACVTSFPKDRSRCGDGVAIKLDLIKTNKERVAALLDLRRWTARGKRLKEEVAHLRMKLVNVAGGMQPPPSVSPSSY